MADISDNKNNTFIPTTEKELESWMIENCYNFSQYSINGNSIPEGFGIDKSGSLFIWYYTERGQKSNIKYFDSEEELIQYAYGQIISDKWAKTHCIGFTTEKTEAKELADLLENLNIKFFQDEIPYYAPQKPVLRTFVFGCDLNRVFKLKEKYLKKPEHLI